MGLMESPEDHAPILNAAHAAAPKAVRYGLNAAILLSTVILVVTWISGRIEIFLGPAHFTVSRGAKPVIVLLALAALRGLVAWRGASLGADLVRMLKSGGVAKPAMSIASVVLFFGIWETGLRKTGFEAELPQVVIRGEQGVDESRTGATIPDPELRWKFNPGADFNGWPVNRIGFLDREVEPEKVPGTIRVICMGDSCTSQGIPPYSGFLHERLQEAPPGDVPWESFNMGVHGYSSAQGLRLFQIRGKALAPDVVTLFYGWNDHWLGGRPDSNSMGLGMNAPKAWFYKQLRDLRIFQYMIHKLNPARKLARTHTGLGLRVPEDEYLWTLTTFIDEIRSIGAVPVLITAPRAEKLTPLLVKNGQCKNLDDVTRLHDEYCELTRQVAKETGTALVDLAEVWSDPESAHFFSGDGIHFQREGRIRLAEILYDELVRLAPGLAVP
jgi:lysophospholipase L1-like esterase